MSFSKVAQILASYSEQHLTQEEIAAKLEKDMPDLLKELSVGFNYLSAWYCTSLVDETEPPVWTDGHIEEVVNDFYLIPKQEDERRTSGRTNPETNKGEKAPKSHIKAKNKNPRTQFELCPIDYNHSIIKEAYDWCLKNLPLKDGSGIRYEANELYIVTSSQKILDKVNARFGSNFSFNHLIGDLRFFISEKN